jgi:hypothetical protein
MSTHCVIDLFRRVNWQLDDAHWMYSTVLHERASQKLRIGQKFTASERAPKCCRPPYSSSNAHRALFFVTSTAFFFGPQFESNLIPFPNMFLPLSSPWIDSRLLEVSTNPKTPAVGCDSPCHVLPRTPSPPPDVKGFRLSAPMLISP